MVLIVLVCNAGANFGFGHLMRCRALAAALNKAGEQCMILGPHSSYREDADSGLFAEWVAIEEWLSPEHEAARLLAIAARAGAHVAVIDDYRADNDYQKVLHNAEFYWLQFDTSIDGPRYPKVLVNPSPGVRAEDYYEVMADRDTVFLFGPEFAILRSEFPPEFGAPESDDALRVLLTFGAGDDRGAAIFALAKLIETTRCDVSFVLVSGEHNPQNDRLIRWVEEHGDGRVLLLVNPSSIASAYAGCDLAIMSGGTSIYEAAACGIPMLLLTIADNQVRQAKAWADTGAALYVGRYGEVHVEKLADMANALIVSRLRRAEMSRIGRSLVDGLGAARVARSVLQLVHRAKCRR